MEMSSSQLVIQLLSSKWRSGLEMQVLVQINGISKSLEYRRPLLENMWKRPWAFSDGKRASRGDEQGWAWREQEIRGAWAKEVKWPSACHTVESAAEKAPWDGTWPQQVLDNSGKCNQGGRGGCLGGLGEGMKGDERHTAT